MDWQKFEGGDKMPKNQRLLLVIQPTGTPDAQEFDIHDVIVGHWDENLFGFVIANVPNETASGARLNVRYWAELPTLPPVKFRKVDGLI